MNNEHSQHLLNVLKAVRDVNRLIARADNFYELCDGLCRVLIDSREYNNAWIVLLKDSVPQQPYFHAGFGHSFKKMAELLDKGFFPVCAERSIKNQKLSVIHNPVKECDFCPFFKYHDESSGFSYPVLWKNDLMGWVSVSVPRKYSEDSEEQILFTEMVNDLAFAVYSLKAREQNKNLAYNYESLIKNTKDPVFILDNNGLILFTNPAADDYYEYGNNNKEVNISVLFPEAKIELLQNSLETVRKEGVVSFLSVVRNKYKKNIDVEISMTKNPDLADSSINCYIHNLTDRDKAVRALRESEEKFQMLFDKAPLGYQSLDDEGCFIEVNQAWLEILGYQREEVIGKFFGDFLHPDYVSDFRERFPLFLERGKIHSEFFMKKKNGDDCCISFEGRIAHNSDGSFKQTHCILNDITDRLTAEKNLREQELYFRNIFENIETGVVIYEAVDNGKDFTIFDMNKSGLILTDSDIDNIRGKKVTDVFPFVKEFGLFKVLQSVYKSGSPSFLSVSEYSDLNITLYLENRVSKLPDGKLIVLFKDYYEQRKMKEEIMQIQKMESLGKLAGGISHDFNNLLTPILGYTELLKRNSSLGKKEQKQIEKIHGASLRASSLVNKLLTFSRKKPVNIKALNINIIINDFMELIAKTIHENIRIKLNLDEELNNIKGDQGQFDQILMNLFVNSQDAMPDGGEIEITSFNRNKDVCLSFKDSGQGIPEPVLSHIFEPFYTTKAVKGTGLGLSTVYGIVNQHKGRIDVKSAPGKGTEFILFFPQSGEKFLQNEEVKEIEKSDSQLRILLVEDDEDVLELLESILNESGFFTEKVLNGRKALELLEKDSNFDLIISDVIMPEMSGLILYEIISSRYRNIKFLFISGYSDDFRINNQYIHTTELFIQKPFTSAAVISKIKDICNI